MPPGDQRIGPPGELPDVAADDRRFQGNAGGDGGGEIGDGAGEELVVAACPESGDRVVAGRDLHGGPDVGRGRPGEIPAAAGAQASGPSGLNGRPDRRGIGGSEQAEYLLDGRWRGGPPVIGHRRERGHE